MYVHDKPKPVVYAHDHLLSVCDTRFLIAYEHDNLSRTYMINYRVYVHDKLQLIRYVHTVTYTIRARFVFNSCGTIEPPFIQGINIIGLYNMLWHTVADVNG